ncbi:MAG: PEP/pyruvate-binding domain-containing protein [Egibacteraceae bacterium]
MGAPLILPLGTLDRGALEAVGGKAANLGELLQADLPVPDGFCVTTAAYGLVADDSPALAGVLDELAGAPADRLVFLATQARQALLATPVPGAVTEAITSAYRALGPATRVAVRSSATAEDLPFASFAGQQETYLNVLGEDAVLDAVRRCWASLWTDRAVAYRAANGIDPRSVQLAVVVQRMVDAAVAGVMFTANPLTGRRGQAVIDASPGLGEAVVSGAVNPDYFVVDTASGAVLERTLGDKRVEIVAVPGGGTRRVERTDAVPAEPCLTDEQLRALAALGRRVEVVYGGEPQDTEFAVDGQGRLWLTQARPITTLYPLPPDAPPPQAEDLRVYFSVNVAQGVFRPFTPMGVQAFRLLASSVARIAGAAPRDPLAGPQGLKEAAGRLFVDVTPVVRSRVGRRVARFVTTHMEARSTDALRVLVADQRLAPLPRSPRALRRAGRVLARYRVPARLLQALRDPTRARREALGRVDAILDAAAAPDHASAAARLDLAERCLLERGYPIVLNLAPLMAAGIGSFGLAFKLLGERATADERDAVRRALPHNPTTAMDLALWSLGARLGADEESARALRERSASQLAAEYGQGALPAPLQQGLADFLRAYGHRGVAEIDLGLPRWADEPAHLLGALANYLRPSDGQAAPDAQFRAAAERADALIDELAHRRRLVGRLVRLLLRRGRELAGLREAPKFHLVALLARVRSQLLVPVGEELTRAGRLDQAGDLFFLDLSEARQLVAGAEDLQPVIRERRASYEAELRRRHVPRVLLSDGTEPVVADALRATDGSALRGAPASAGLVTGTARVVLDPVGARLEPGEILVAPSTDPGWTPLFLTAGGLVMEMGGAMSHGAVVAREYGIPAVVGVPEATERIRTGDQITVDGSAGTVVVGDAAPEARADGEGEVSWDPPIPGSKWVRRQVVEHMPDPLSPLFEELYVREGLERPIDGLLEFMLGDISLRFEDMMDRPLFTTVNGFAYQRADYHLRPTLLPTLLRATVAEMRTLFSKGDAYWRDQALPRYLATVDRWRLVDAATLADEDLLRGVRELAWADAECWYGCALVVGAAKLTDGLLNRFLTVAVRGRNLTSGLFLRGFPSKTLEGDATLEALADRVRASDALRQAVLDTPPAALLERLREAPGGGEVLAGLERYFRDFGHQIYSLDFAEPTQADDPAPTLRSLQVRVAGEPRDVRTLQAAIARERDACTEQTARVLDPARRRVFRTLLGWAQRYGPGREEALFCLGAGWPTLRRLAAELGRRLAAAGSLDAPDDVFFLETAELQAAIAARAAGAPQSELARLAQQRRALRELRMRLRAPAAVPPKARLRLGPIDLSVFETQKRNEDTGDPTAPLRGFPVSPGRATAPASVILGPHDFSKMASGSILVCPTTTPAWTPLFAQAAGLVTDIGGILAHGSIVAREYGIPAVMGTGSGTRRIHHGETITVDGDRGLVYGA